MISKTIMKTSMSLNTKDPIGQALIDYYSTGSAPDITVESDVLDDDVIPVAYLFRKEKELPELERLALSLCAGKKLDIGACSGVHSSILKRRMYEVESIDISKGAVDVMLEQGLSARHIDFFQLQDESFNTLLFLMNGTGIAGSLDHFERLLKHASSLLEPEGQILIDSTDIRYIYEDEDGGIWVDLNGSYYGEIEFKMRYKNHSSDWFKWLYLDQEKMIDIANKCGFSCEIVFQEDEQYLAQLRKK